MHVPVYTDKISRYLLFDVLQDFYDIHPQIFNYIQDYWDILRCLPIRFLLGYLSFDVKVPTRFLGYLNIQIISLILAKLLPQ